MMTEYVVTTTTEKTMQAATAAEVGAVMSDVHTRRELPRSSVELVGQAAGDVVGGIGRGSIGLAVIVLNIIGIGAAVYFLNLLISGQQQHLGNLLKVQTDQLKEIVVVHNREFDALMDMQTKTTAALAAATTAAAAAAAAANAPQAPPQSASPPRR